MNFPYSFQILGSESSQDIDVMIFVEKMPMENKQQNQLGKVTILDFQKTFAFQMGQCQGLIEGQELYTKEAISAYFPALSGYLLRKENLDNIALNDFKNILLEKIMNFLK